MSRAYAIIRQYDGGSAKWFIQFHGTPEGWHDKRDPEYWLSCPGTLHEDYDTAEKAIRVAEWWGFRAQTA
jgi:hypothetical protein